MKVNFTIGGEPRAKARPRMSVSTGKAYTTEQTVLYENWIRLMYNSTVKHFFEGNVKMTVICYFDITKKDREALKKNKVNTKAYKDAIDKVEGLIRPSKKPDLDNIIKSVADSLNGIAYKDDSQIVEVVSKKYYSDKPRVEVELEDII
ncbi:TPA: RusA family crossover junction endodeoxyribonuclease [Clostridioides difficile]